LGLLGLVLLAFSIGLLVYSINLAFYPDYNAASFQSNSCPPDLRNRSTVSATSLGFQQLAHVVGSQFHLSPSRDYGPSSIVFYTR